MAGSRFGITAAIPHSFARKIRPPRDEVVSLFTARKRNIPISKRRCRILFRVGENGMRNRPHVSWSD
jgi:hypothetical protein